MTTYYQGSDLYCCRMGDTVVVFHEGAQEYFQLNETGALMWELLREPRSCEDLVVELRSHFDVDEELCRSESEGFLKELVSRRLVVCSDS